MSTEQTLEVITLTNDEKFAIQNAVLRKKEPEKFAQAVFFLNSDPESWAVPNAGQLVDGTINLSYAPQIIPERERRAYVHFVVG